MYIQLGFVIVTQVLCIRMKELKKAKVALESRVQKLKTRGMKGVPSHPYEGGVTGKRRVKV